jgi:hypothetical protein
VPVKIVISRSIFRSARQINFRACLIATLGLGGMAQIVCVACLQSVLQRLTYNLRISSDIKNTIFPNTTVYTVLWVAALWNVCVKILYILNKTAGKFRYYSYSLLAFSLKGVNELWHWVAYEFACISIRSFFYSLVDGSVHIFMQILPNLFHATCNANGILSWHNNVWTLWCTSNYCDRFF